MSDDTLLKNCWEASWDVWPEVPKEVPHGSDYVAGIYQDENIERAPVEAPEPFNEIIERVNYADASVFEAFPNATMFERPMMLGESWPEDSKDANAVRVVFIDEGLRARLFFFDPELVR